MFSFPSKQTQSRTPPESMVVDPAQVVAPIYPDVNSIPMGQPVMPMAQPAIPMGQPAIPIAAAIPIDAEARILEAEERARQAEAALRLQEAEMRAHTAEQALARQARMVALEKALRDAKMPGWFGG